MADIITTSGIITGAVVSMGTLAAKYVFDRLTEAHKVEMGLAAKRRERYHAKQAEVIAGAYERLLRCVDLIGMAGFPEGQLFPDRPVQKTDFNKELADKAWEAQNEFRRYFAENELYFSRPLADVIRKYAGVLIDATSTCKYISNTDNSIVSEEELRRMGEATQRTREILNELRNAFRKLMER